MFCCNTQRLTLTLFSLFSLLAASCPADENLAVESAPWTRLMDHRDGWTGADGIFTASLDGTITEGVEKRPGQNTVFVFSDTILGKIDPETHERSDTKMVNHSFGLLRGNRPESDAVTFYYPEDGYTPGLPLKPEKDGQWYWLSDCFVLKTQQATRLYTFLLRMEKAGQGGTFGFRHLGVDLARFDIQDGKIDFDSVKIFHDNPENPRLGVYHPPGQKDTATFTLGCGTLENLVKAGVPEAMADGYVYVYGFRQNGMTRQLIAARFLPEDTERFDRWRYYAGDGHWSEELTLAAGLTQDVSTELSVTPILSGPKRGKYALVYTPGTIGSKIALRVGESPVGPFGKECIVYEETETKRIGQGAFAYNAKAHPVISRTGELLISYNINSMDDTMRIFRFGGIYYPRFVAVKTDDL